LGASSEDPVGQRSARLKPRERITCI
jgi:hypothetical protein